MMTPLDAQMGTLPDFFKLGVGQYGWNEHIFAVGRGFGYTRDEEGIPQYREHKFKVKISKTAFVGNGTNIDIGRDRDTEIRDHTVIDSLVHVGHSAIIGKKCIIVSGTVIGGHVEIGDGCHIGENVSIKQGVKIGRGSFIGAGSFVNTDIPVGVLAYGNPIRIIKHVSEASEYVQRSVHFEN